MGQGLFGKENDKDGPLDFSKPIPPAESNSSASFASTNASAEKVQGVESYSATSVDRVTGVESFKGDKQASGEADKEKNTAKAETKDSDDKNQKNTKDGSQNHNKGFIILVSALAAVSGLLFGFDTGVISGALLFIKKDFHIDSTLQEFVTSSVLIGAMIGALCGGLFVDKLGRRMTLIVASIVFVIGSASTALSPFVWWLIGSRFIVGLGVGVASYIGPMYISELAPPKMRGSLVTLNQLYITSGILVAYLVDLALSPSGLWRWMFAVHVIPATVLGVSMFFLPDSPRYLVENGKDDKAKKNLQKIRATDNVDEEFNQIKQNVSNENRSWGALFAPAIRPAMIIGIGLAVFQQVTGINTIIYYAPTIFQSAGIKGNTGSILATVVVGVVNVALTVVSIILVDKVGRKPLLLWGIGGMVVGLAGLGGGFLFQGNNFLMWITLAFLLIYIASFAVGLGPIFWLLISEIFPNNMRGRAESVSTIANWGANFVVAITFLTLINWLGHSVTFWLYAVLGVANFFFVMKLVPETKGKSLEEIQQQWGVDSDQNEQKKHEKNKNRNPGSGAMPQGG